MVSMNRLTTEKRRQIIASLVEGNSIRATCRMTGASKNTVAKLLVDMGAVCSKFQDEVMRDLPCRRIECDEIWSFVYAKKRNVPAGKSDEFGYGDVWTWVALDSDTKLVPVWLIGNRNTEDASLFMNDVARRMASPIQLTTDGFRPYLQAVRGAFQEVDYGQIQKIYGSVSGGAGRYSPGVCIGASRYPVSGNPDLEKISTSYVERQNLTMRMGMRRFTRLTNAFSKKVENLAAAVSLHFAYYNFCRVHQTLKTTPAVAAGITDHVWKLDELVALLAEIESAPVKRGPYKKRRQSEISK
jgi:IS1 family transposase